MNGKSILVAYGTRYGSARYTATEIAAYLKNKGYNTNLVDLRSERAPSLPGNFDLVIAGSSIAMFSWVGKVKSFLRKCRRASVPTAVFITCGTAIEDEANARSRFLDRVINRIGLNPELTLVTGPVIDFRPGKGLPTGLKNRMALYRRLEFLTRKITLYFYIS